MWWSVSVDGFMPASFKAATRDKARFAAFRQLREAGYVWTFRDFLTRVGSVRPISADEAAVCNG